MGDTPQIVPVEARDTDGSMAPGAGVSPRAVLRGPLVLSAGALVVAVLAVVMALGVGRAAYPADAPAATLQAYLDACERGDGDAAYAMLSPTAQARFGRFRWDESLRWWQEAGPHRVWVETVVSSDDRATLTVLEERTEDDILGIGRDRERRTVRLVRLDRDWRIDDPIAGLWRQYE